jgi:tryptophanyl-tRNA synthetase
MAADIYAQKSDLVAVGEDQIPHLEIARDLADSFNGRFKREILVHPKLLAVDSVRVAALDGKGKMSKSNEPTALMFSDDPKVTERKIKRATTAAPGEWNDTIESHFQVAEHTTSDPDKLRQLAELRTAHIAGEKVMGEFKKLWTEITEVKVLEFQVRRAQISDDDVHDVLRAGAEKAAANADEVLASMKGIMTF